MAKKGTTLAVQRSKARKARNAQLRREEETREAGRLGITTHELRTRRAIEAQQFRTRREVFVPREWGPDQFDRFGNPLRPTFREPTYLYGSYLGRMAA